MSDRPCVTHEWREVPDEAGQYLCIACCTSGYRSKHGKGVVPHKVQDKKYRKTWTAPGHTAGRGGRVAPKRGAP